MSPAQQRLWLLHKLDPDATTFNLPFAFRLKGKADPPMLARILSAIVERHEVFRTTLASIDEQPVQVIDPAGPVEIPLSDLSECPPAARQEALLGELETVAGRPFDLAAGPLLRPALWRLEEDEHALLLVMHHSISDGWSLGVIAKEFAELWTAQREGREPQLPPLAIQYADYACWHRARLDGGELDSQRQYWLEQLSGHRGILRLPTDRPRQAPARFEAAVHEFQIPPSTVEALRRLGSETGVTMFMSTISAYALLLSAYSGERDLLVGIPMAGRTQTELEPLIGFFVNALALRFRLDPAATSRDLVRQTRKTVLDASANQD